MSRTIVRLMLHTRIPFTVWLEQPDGVIETALQMLTDPDEGDDELGGPVMGG